MGDLQDYPYICTNCGAHLPYYYTESKECEECGGSVERRCTCTCDACMSCERR